MAQDSRERTDTRDDAEPVHQMLVRLPQSLAKRLRARAFAEERAKVAVIRDALTEYLDRREK